MHESTTGGFGPLYRLCCTSQGQSKNKGALEDKPCCHSAWEDLNLEAMHVLHLQLTERVGLTAFSRSTNATQN